MFGIQHIHLAGEALFGYTDTLTGDHHLLQGHPGSQFHIDHIGGAQFHFRGLIARVAEHQDLGLIGGDAEGARKTINRWVEGKTRDKIQNLIPSGGVDALTRLVLTNAIYFKGEWVSPFKKAETRDEPFTAADGAKALIRQTVYVVQRAHKPSALGRILDRALEVLMGRGPDGENIAVGAFEGAFYHDHGYYRSEQNCIMFSRTERFCLVCRAAIDKAMDDLVKPMEMLTNAVLDDPAMPIVGEGDEEPNDTFIEQLVSSAQAAADEMVRRGVGEHGRMAVGGHSYGAFMTANLLAHSDIFAAGIARSGAYNRTLTPFGFQAEERSLWEAPEIYFAMSPFMHAEKVDEPILLVHGAADNNSGTFPMQSERMYDALKGHGATARLVMLPHESHGYRARESLMHLLWETHQWLERYVKNAPPREAGEASPAGQ